MFKSTYRTKTLYRPLQSADQWLRTCLEHQETSITTNFNSNSRNIIFEVLKSIITKSLTCTMQMFSKVKSVTQLK